MDFGICQKISSYITRPPRTQYNIDDLGPEQFSLRNHEYERVDFIVLNQRQQRIECSLFREIFHHKSQKVDKQTVIFLHANSSSRLAAKNYLAELLPFFNIACLDCSGSGNSDGDLVTLGYYEKQDLRALIKTLKLNYGLKGFFLWGRSMGAVTALLYAAKYGQLLGVVADNAFSDLYLTCKQLKNSYFPILPDFLLDTLLEQTQEHIDTNINTPMKLQFSLSKLKPIQVVNKINCPIFYIYSENDKIVPNYHTKSLYEKSNYPKRIMSVKGDHNGIRDVDIKGKVVDYLLQIVVNNKKNNNKCNQKDQEIQINYNNVKKGQTRIRSYKVQSQIGVSPLQYESPLNEILCKSYINNSNSNKFAQRNQQEFSYYINSQFQQNIKNNEPYSILRNEQRRRSSQLSSYSKKFNIGQDVNNQRKRRRKIFDQNN